MLRGFAFSHFNCSVNKTSTQESVNVYKSKQNQHPAAVVTFQEILKHEELSKPKSPEHPYQPPEELSQKNFWSSVMKSEGREKAYKMLQKNYGSSEGITTRLSDGTLICLKKTINLTDFSMISSMWNQYQ